jgi:hypothetical protein
MTKNIVKTEEKTDTRIKISFSIPDRVNFPTILPRKSDSVGWALNEALVKRVAITKKEEEEYGLVYLPDERIGFVKATNKEFCFEIYEFFHIQLGAKILEESKELEKHNHALARKILDIIVKTKESE